MAKRVIKRNKSLAVARRAQEKVLATKVKRLKSVVEANNKTSSSRSSFDLRAVLARSTILV